MKLDHGNCGCVMTKTIINQTHDRSNSTKCIIHTHVTSGRTINEQDIEKKFSLVTFKRKKVAILQAVRGLSAGYYSPAPGYYLHP